MVVIKENLLKTNFKIWKTTKYENIKSFLLIIR